VPSEKRRRKEEKSNREKGGVVTKEKRSGGGKNGTARRRIFVGTVVGQGQRLDAQPKIKTALKELGSACTEGLTDSQ